MAVYPGGIKSWAARRNQIDVVDASDFNQLAAEVTAMQQAIGSNPARDLDLNGKRVTWSTLDERVSSIERGLNNPFIRLDSASESIKSGAWVVVNFDSPNVIDNPFTMFNSIGFTVKRTGYWSLTADLKWPNNYAGYRAFNIIVGGTEVAGDSRSASLPGAGVAVPRQNVSWQGRINAGTAVAVEAYQNSGVVLTTTGVTLSGAFLRDL